MQIQNRYNRYKGVSNFQVTADVLSMHCESCTRAVYDKCEIIKRSLSAMLASSLYWSNSGSSFSKGIRFPAANPQ